MPEVFPYVYVENSGRANGFHDPLEATKIFCKQNYGFHYDSEMISESCKTLLDTGEVRIDVHNIDCSPRLAVVFANTSGADTDTFLNKHLDTHPRSVDYVAKASAAWFARSGPRVGDYCTEGFKLTRFTHEWDDTMQTGGGAGGYFMYNDGLCSYSGGLDPGVSKAKIVDKEHTMLADFWFFLDGWPGARRGTSFVLPVRSYGVIVDKSSCVA